MRTCPRCGGAVADQAPACPGCGFAMAAPTKPSRATVGAQVFVALFLVLVVILVGAAALSLAGHLFVLKPH